MSSMAIVIKVWDIGPFCDAFEAIPAEDSDSLTSTDDDDSEELDETEDFADDDEELDAED